MHGDVFVDANMLIDPMLSNIGDYVKIMAEKSDFVCILENGKAENMKMCKEIIKKASKIIISSGFCMMLRNEKCSNVDKKEKDHCIALRNYAIANNIEVVNPMDLTVLEKNDENMKIVNVQDIDEVDAQRIVRICNSNISEIFAISPRDPEEKNYIEARVAVVGNVDVGKTTLVGVPTHSELDDGRGAARTKLFRHKHEFESGRTSSVGNYILGFDVHGSVGNKPDPNNHNLDWVQIESDCAKLITFIDLAGHEKYLKTTIFGMTGFMPDYTMLMIGANMGIIGTTKKHLSLTLSLHVPFYLVVTKIDMCPENILEEKVNNITKLVKSAKKLPILVRTMDDVVYAAVNFPSKKVCPIFQVSNVKGTNLPLLHQFLNIVPLRRSLNENYPAHFQIDDIYWIDGVGTIVSGTLLSGIIRLDDIMLLGPTSNGDFHPIPIKSIHRKRMPTGIVKCGQSASLALQKISKKDVRKGMVLVDQKTKPVASMLFEAEILVLAPTIIRTNYQAMLHVGSVRQAVTLVSMRKEVLKTGDRDKVHFKFIRQPEYIRPGSNMILREGRIKAVDTVLSMVSQESSFQQEAKQKEGRNKHYGKKTGGPKTPNVRPKDEKQLEARPIDKLANSLA
ncbi:hypothetical protein L3Y34_001008 [Caenorhabditis briggsae]|uniref:Tr-type G domain-containing protein n=1 Tax=Caenorhabditis briggsae TaxID=6238 RepID=A0AAE9DBK5_CAEBR|nr:hypothetical protein L3Y34_001008 [Caenorhabditis briggsae]